MKMSNMSQEEIMHEEEMNEVEEEGLNASGNNPDERPISETGYVVNPDGSVGHPGEEWDDK